jgi:hypothetical protein
VQRARLVRPGKNKGLTASAQNADESSGALLRLDQSWQREVMGYYRAVGECWNPAQYYSRAMERIRFYPAIRNERGIPEEVESGELVDLFRRIQTPSAPPGDLSEIAGTYGRLQFLIGDGLLTVSQEDGDEVWEYLSPMELRLNPRSDDRRPQEYRRLRAPGTPPEELTEVDDREFAPLAGDDIRVWRLWRRHPEYSQWADSPVRPVRELYEVLQRLTLAVGAEASSRAAQRGLLFIPEELSFGPADPTQDENPEEDPLIREFQEAMQRAIRNPGTAEAMAPFIMRAPGLTTTAGGAVPTADLIKWMALGPTERYLEGEMWDRVIARLAGSLDLPKEMLTGIEDVSHWSAWFLDEIGFRQHTGPTVVRFCNDLAGAYLRPAAVDAGIENAENVVIWFDASQAINHPDETGTARDAHDRLVVSDAWYREKIGAPDDAAPQGDELERRVAIKLKEFPSDMQPEPPAGSTPPPQGGRGGDVEEGPPQNGSEPRPPGVKAPAPAGPAMSAMIVGAAMMQIDRARELAGQRLIRRAQTCVDCRDKVKNVPAALVAAALGRDTVREVIDGHGTEASLVNGIGDAFAARVRAWQIDGGWPEQLGNMVEQHALRTLYEPEVPPFPPGFLSACQRACG